MSLKKGELENEVIIHFLQMADYVWFVSGLDEISLPFLAIFLVATIAV